MEKKSLLQLFREVAGPEQRLAERIVKILGENGIISIDILMSKTANELLAIKGIGERMMVMISRVMTKEEAERKRIQDVFKKTCCNKTPTCLRDWFQKAGATYSESCIMEKIMRKNGIDTIDDFLMTDPNTFYEFKGIAVKRLERIEKTQKLIQSSRKKKK